MQIFRILVEITKDIQGAKVENHKFCVSVHYRNVEENVSVGCNHEELISFFHLNHFIIFFFFFLLNELQNWTTIGQRVHDVLKDYPLLRSTHGRKVCMTSILNWKIDTLFLA